MFRNNRLKKDHSRNDHEHADPSLSVIHDILAESQRDNRSARRWNHFFKLLMFSYLFSLLFIFRDGIEDRFVSDDSHVAIIPVYGAISPDSSANASTINAGLNEAFEHEKTEAIILDINSPGGSPVQAELVYKEIDRLSLLHPNIPVYAVIQEQGASAAYYIAAATDKIFASEASVVGSIGVISAGFGYSGIMKEYGLERRLYTSGKNKAFLDPFSPEKKSDVTFWNEVLTTTHEQMKRRVQSGRGDRLQSNPELFEGYAWTGEQALEMGLIDGIGGSKYVAREIVGVDNLVQFGKKPSFFEKMTSQLGASIGHAALDQMAAQQFLPELH